MSARTRAFEGAVVAIALLIMIPLAEVVVRLVAPQRLPSQQQIRTYVLKGMYVPDEKSGFRPTPGFSGRIERAGLVTEFSLNSLGLRGAELGAKTKPRIAAFGDSFTWGWGCPQGKEWIQVAGQEVDRMGTPVEAVNCGVNAFGTGSAVGFLEDVGPQVKPDVVLLGFFANDYTDNLLADMLGTPAAYTVRDGYLFDSFSAEYFRETWLARESHLYRLLSSATETFRVRTLHGLPSSRAVKQFTPEEFERGMELSARQILRMKDVADSLGARFAVVWLPADVYALSRTRPEDITLQVALQQRVAAAGIPSLDLLPIVTAEDRIAGLYIPNDGHFTERGNAVAGRAVAKWILESGLLAGTPAGSAGGAK